MENSEQENRIDALINYDSQYWIGLNDIATEGTFVNDTAFCFSPFKL